MRDIALVGTGYWGKNLARCFHELGALRILCDSELDRARNLAASWTDIHVTASFEEVLKSSVQAVAIATPAVSHAKLAKQALEAGKDVFVEKPLALDVADAAELTELARKHNRILMVGHLLQYHPCIRRLQELVEEGALGRLRYITSNRLNLGLIRTEENSLWSFAPHDFSVILSLAGNQAPDQVRCTGESHLTAGVADSTLTALRFPSGLRAHVYVSWVNPFKEQKLTVVGDNGLVVFDDREEWDKKLAFYPNPVRWEGGQRPIATKPEPEYRAVKEEEPLLNECAHFLNAVENRTQPKTDGEEGERVLAVLRAAQESLRLDGKAASPGDPRESATILPSTCQVHSSAVIDEGCQLGNGTTIWHFTHVMSDAKIGERCNLGQNVVVSPGVVLGDGCRVQNNVSIYTGVECEEDVFLGPSMVFTNVINPRSAISRKDEYQSTLIRRGATIGANATIVCGTVLGEYCFVGAAAVVTRDVAPYALVVGNPARQIGWMSRCGERLDLPLEAVSTPESCRMGGVVYRLEGTDLSAREEA